jgi:hypothetical protein
MSKSNQAIKIVTSTNNPAPEVLVPKIMEQLKVPKNIAARYFNNALKAVREKGEFPQIEATPQKVRQARSNVREYLTSVGPRTQHDRLLAMKMALRVVKAADRNDPTARKVAQLISRIDKTLDQIEEVAGEHEVNQGLDS